MSSAGTDVGEEHEADVDSEHEAGTSTTGESDKVCSGDADIHAWTAGIEQGDIRSDGGEGTGPDPIRAQRAGT